MRISMNERPSATESELARFQGTWRTVTVEVDGSPVPHHEYEDARLVIAGHRFTLWNPLSDAGQRVEGSLRVDPTRIPKELDLCLDSGRALEEVYELEGDILRVCYPLRGEADRLEDRPWVRPLARGLSPRVVRATEVWRLQG
jgi:uncharacterized protein (TIGR03067 family)